jgi:predicted transcriptional regulator
MGLASDEHTTDETQHSIEADTLLAMLGDDYATDIIKTISQKPRSARDIASKLDVSKPTVYRRLERLQDAGLVDASIEYDPEGHHRQQFYLVLDGVELSFEGGGITVNT